METEFEQMGDTLIVRLRGELDHHSASASREKIDEKIDSCRCRNLILSFGEMGFMDSAGIGMVLGRYNKRKEAGGKMMLAGGGRNVRRILEMAGVYTLLPHWETEQEAMEKMAQEAKQEAANGRER